MKIMDNLIFTPPKLGTTLTILSGPVNHGRYLNLTDLPPFVGVLTIPMATKSYMMKPQVHLR